MKKLFTLFAGLLFILSACGKSESAIQKKETYVNLFNTQMDGIQSDQLKQANESFYNGNYSRSLEIYSNILNDFIVSDNQEAIINSLFLISASLIKLQRYQESFETLNTVGKRITLFLDKSKEKNYYRTFHLVEMGNLLIESNLSPSEEYTEGILKHALKEAYDIGNKYLIAKSYRNLGYFYLLKKEIDLAEYNLKRALALANKSQNINFLAQTIHLMAKLYMEKGNYTEALDHLVTGYKVYQLNSYFFQQATLLITIGDLYNRINDPQKAFRYYKRAFEMISKNTAIEEKTKAQYLNPLEKKIELLIQENIQFKEFDFFSN